MLFSRLDRLVLTEWVKMLVLTISVVVGLFVVADVQNHLDNLLLYGATAREILRYYLLLVPTFLPTVMPLAVLVSLLIALGGMHRRLEIVAMRNAGLSILRITRPVWLLGLLLCGGLFWLNADFVPWSKETSRELWDQLRFRGELRADKPVEEIGILQNLTFNNLEERRRWFINRFSEFDFNAYGLTISLFDTEGRETTRILSNRGYYDDNAGYWVLLDGREVTFDSASGDALRNLGFERREMPGLTEDPVLMQYLQKKPQDLSFWQLRRVEGVLQRAQDPGARKYSLRLYRFLVSPLDVLIALALAVRFSMGAIRANAFVGTAKGLGVFVAYFLLAQGMGVLAGEDASTFVIALAPTLLMLLLSFLLTLRTGHPV
jgi:lipopolysaccharide export system permease protein